MNRKTKIVLSVVFVLIFSFFAWLLADDIFSGDDTMSLISMLYGRGKFNIDGIFTALLTQTVGIWIPQILHINPHIF